MENTPQATFSSSSLGPRYVKRPRLLKRLASITFLAVIAPIAFWTAGSTPAALANQSCANLSLINGDFEATLPDPKPNSNFYWGDYLDASQLNDVTDQYQNVWKAVPGIGWRTTQSDSHIEFWSGDPLLNEDGGVVAFDGNAFVELNAGEKGALYQDVTTIPGTTMVWSLAHRGRDGLDTMAVKIGDPAVLTTLGAPTSSLRQGPELADNNTAWGVHTGIYVVPADQLLTRFWFESIAQEGNDSYGNFLDGISFRPYNCFSETPTFAPPSIVGTPDGFTFQLTNYDSAGMTATASVGQTTISSTGTVTLRGAPSSTSTTVRVTNHHNGFIDASVDVTAYSIGSALVPKFDTPVDATGGFAVTINNFDPLFDWDASATDGSTVTIDRSAGVITVPDPITTTTVVRVSTSRTSYLSGSSFVSKASVKVPTVVFNPVVNNPGSGSSYEAPVVQIPVKLERKPVSVSIGGFKNGSSVLTAAMKSKIRKFITRYKNYKVISITGFTEGPTVLKRDRALSRMRAVNALSYVKLGSSAKFDSSNIQASQEKTLGSNIRRIQITLQD